MIGSYLLKTKNEKTIYIPEVIYTSKGWVPPINYNTMLIIQNKMEDGYSERRAIEMVAGTSRSRIAVDPRELPLRQGDEINEYGGQIVAASPIGERNLESDKLNYYIPQLDQDAKIEYLKTPAKLLAAYSIDISPDKFKNQVEKIWGVDDTISTRLLENQARPLL